jgi:hypothetical protein
VKWAGSTIAVPMQKSRGRQSCLAASTSIAFSEVGAAVIWEKRRLNNREVRMEECILVNRKVMIEMVCDNEIIESKECDLSLFIFF